MSRLADAESKLAAALDALEAAITATETTPEVNNAGVMRGWTGRRSWPRSGGSTRRLPAR